MLGLSIHQILRRKEVMVRELAPFAGTILRDTTFYEFVREIHRLLPLGVPQAEIVSVVGKSLCHLAGRKLTERQIECEVWRLLGNIETLRGWLAVPPWTHQQYDEWIPMQVISGQTYKTPRRHIFGYLFKFRALAGSCCPMILEQFWSQALCRVLARRLGFTRVEGERPFQNSEELVQMRLLGLVEQKLSAKAPTFHTIHATESMLLYNRKLQRARLRLPQSGFCCPYKYQHPCHQCPVGYAVGKKTCPAAVRPVTLEARICPHCREEGFFDPTRPRITQCVNCEHRQRMGGEA